MRLRHSPTLSPELKSELDAPELGLGDFRRGLGGTPEGTPFARSPVRLRSPRRNAANRSHSGSPTGGWVPGNDGSPLRLSAVTRSSAALSPRHMVLTSPSKDRRRLRPPRDIGGVKLDAVGSRISQRMVAVALAAAGLFCLLWWESLGLLFSGHPHQELQKEVVSVTAPSFDEFLQTQGIGEAEMLALARRATAQAAEAASRGEAAPKPMIALEHMPAGLRAALQIAPMVPAASSASSSEEAVGGLAGSGNVLQSAELSQGALRAGKSETPKAAGEEARPTGAAPAAQPPTATQAAALGGADIPPPPPPAPLDGMPLIAENATLHRVVDTADAAMDPANKKVFCSSRFETTGSAQLRELTEALGLAPGLSGLADLAESACRLPPQRSAEDQCYIMYTGEKYHYCAKGADCTYNITSMHERQNDGMGSQIMTYLRVMQLAIETGCTYVHRPLIGVDHLGDPEVGAKKAEAFFSIGDGCLSLFNFTPDTAIAQKVESLLRTFSTRRLDSEDPYATFELELGSPDQQHRGLDEFSSSSLVHREQSLDRTLALSDLRLRHVVAFGSHKRTKEDTSDMLAEFQRFCGPGSAPDGRGVLCHLAWPAARYLIFETFSPATYLLSRVALRRRFHKTFQAPKQMPPDWAQEVHLAVHIRRGDVLHQAHSGAEVEKKRTRNKEEILSALAALFADLALAEYDPVMGVDRFFGDDKFDHTPYKVHIMSQGAPQDFAWVPEVWDELLATASTEAYERTVQRFAFEDAAAGRTTPRTPPPRQPLQAGMQLHLKENPFVTLSMMANSDILVGLSQSAFLELASNLQSVSEAMFLDWTSWKKANHRNRVLTRDMRCDLRAVLHHARDRVARVKAAGGDAAIALDSPGRLFWNAYPKGAAPVKSGT